MLARLRRRSPTRRRATFAWAALTALATLGACSAAGSHDVGADASVSDAPAPPARSIVVDGSSSLRLAPLAEATLRLRLLDESGRGVEAERVSFALAGEPRSSTLRQLEASSAADGSVSVVLVAGPLPTTFQVRATATGAAPLLVDVSVGTEFGELEVVVRADVSRPVDAYVVRAVADVPCGELPDASGDERRVGTELPSTRFPALSTSAAWTVEVRGVSAAEQVLARGCVEGLRVSASAPARATVEVRDLPLRVDGVYAVSIALAAGALGAEARSMTLGTAIPDTGATLLLDGLREELESRATGDVTSLRVSRAAGLDAQLATELEMVGATLPEILAPLADEVEVGFESLSLAATLRHGATSSLEVSSARAGTAIAEGPYVASLLGVDASPETDELAVRGVDVRVGAASVFVAGLIERGRARSVGGFSGHLRDGYACGTMLNVVTRERILSLCDASCVRAGCERAATTLERSMREHAAVLDESHAAIRLDATVSLADRDADLRADETSAEGIAARWEAVDGAAGVTLEARWTGTRDDTLE